MNDEEKIRIALDLLEKMINVQEDMHFSHLHAMEEIKNVFVDKHIPLGNMDELTEIQENLHVAHRKGMEEIKKILES